MKPQGKGESDEATPENVASAVIKDGDAGMLGKMIEKGFMSASGKDGKSPYLVVGAMEGHLGIVKLLVEHGAEVNAPDDDGASALAWAALKGHTGVARFLLKNEAAVDSRDRNGNTPLDWAAMAGETGLVNLLLSHGASSNNIGSDGKTVFLRAAEKGHASVVRALLARDCDSERRDKMGRTALILAAQNGQLEVVNILLEAKVNDLTSRDRQGLTALDHAAGQGKFQVIERLLEFIGPERVESMGGTALGWACTSGNAPIARLLLENKVFVDAVDREGASCLSRAAVRGHYETAKLLLEHGADPNLSDRKRNTPLHHTAFHGYTKVANLLLDHKAEANLVNVFGQTPLDRAAQGRGGDTMRRLLQDFGGTYVQGETGKKRGGKKEIESAVTIIEGEDKKKHVVIEKKDKDRKDLARGHCRFEKGKCPYGSKCRFSHSWSSDENPNSWSRKHSDENVISEGDVEVRKIGPATSSSNEDKNRPCPQWNSKGRCRFGDRCKFLHDADAKGAKSMKKKASSMKSNINNNNNVSVENSGAADVTGLGQGGGGDSSNDVALASLAGAIGSMSSSNSISSSGLSVVLVRSSSGSSENESAGPRRSSEGDVFADSASSASYRRSSESWMRSSSGGGSGEPSPSFSHLAQSKSASASPRISCGKCNMQLTAGARFCLRCGVAQNNSPRSSTSPLNLDDRNSLRLSVAAEIFVPTISSPKSLSSPPTVVRGERSFSTGSTSGNSETSSQRSSARSSTRSSGTIFSAFGSDSSLFLQTPSADDAIFGASQTAVSEADKPLEEDWEGDIASLGSLLDDEKDL